MEKNEMYDDKKNGCQVRKLPRPMGAWHRQCGLWVLGGGSHASSIAYDRCPLRYFEYYSLSHMHDGGGRFLLPGSGEIEVRPGDCVLISPGTVHRYGGADGLPYVEDAVRFLGPIADTLFQAGIIQDGVFRLGSERKVLPIWEDSRDPGRISQLAANIALQGLLWEIYRQHRQRSENYSPFEKLLLELKSDIGRWWTVEELACLSGLSAFRLRRLFLENTGTTPKNYIEQLKIQRAIELLTTETQSVRTIARKLGYIDPYHFSRRFKHLVGFSPALYRKRASSGG